jgi:hypothetical protein
VIRTEEGQIARARTAVGRRLGPLPGERRPPAQAFCKVVGNRKSRAGARDLFAYVARNTPSFKRDGLGPLTLFDGTGARLPMTSAAELADDWELMLDNDNLSPAARRAREEGGRDALRDMPERERLRNVQVWHLIWSAKEERGEPQPAARGRFTEAVRSAVFDLFDEAGHKVVWTVHSDTDHLHAHIVVRAENHRGRRIRFDKAALDEMRTVFGKHTRRCGFNVVAERREDRSELRDEIADGEAPLRLNERLVDKHKPREARDLAQAAPTWYLQEAAEVERRRADEAARREAARREAAARRAAGDRKASAQRIYLDQLPPPAAAATGAAASKSRLARLLGRGGPNRPPRVPGIPAELQAIYPAFERAFVDPKAALESWCRCATERPLRDLNTGRIVYPNLALARWHLRKRPQTFGAITQAAPELGTRAFRKILDRVTPALAQVRPLDRRTLEPAITDLKRQTDGLMERARVMRARASIYRSLAHLAMLDRQRLRNSGVSNTERADEIERRARAVLERPMPQHHEAPPLARGLGARLLDPFRRGGRRER